MSAESFLEGLYPKQPYEIDSKIELPFEVEVP